MKEDVRMDGLFDKDTKWQKSGDFDIDEHIRRLKGKKSSQNISMAASKNPYFPDIASIITFAFISFLIFITIVMAVVISL